MSMRFAPILALFVFARCASAGICYTLMEQPGRCSSVLEQNVSREECCSYKSIPTAWSDKNLDSGALFFWKILEGGAKCTPCDETCNGVKCSGGRRCVMRDGKAKCICRPKCDRAGPACGTDGRTYRSLCKLRKKACQKPQKHLTLDYTGVCKVGTCSGVRCSSDKRCVLDTELVAHCVRCSSCNVAGPQLCAVNGHTYAGSCALRQAACLLGRSLPLAYKGPCLVNATCDTIECGPGQKCITGGPTGVQCVSCDVITTCVKRNGNRHGRRKLCGSDGHTYTSWCELQDTICKTGKYLSFMYPGPCLGNSSDIQERL